ncbi:protein of unknown function (DUF397) [Nocardia amikacinitolerans]|uniref:DUF397 domain-containing protein n=1 Tax=Nocardia amikacinitolerans TaxID=756689 RepID=UPI0008374872|nr:DUF397 domain-containing protein [Nocardia amikacinitolerans]MCP2317067.1 protein of unknown function (DUF397) [Nocardia amikacinitolerans]
MTIDDRLAWRTSTYSGAGENCVEVAPAESSVYLRHSKRPADGTITFDAVAWSRFVREVLGLASDANGVVAVEISGDATLVRSLSGPELLSFDDGEWSAFRAGARDGEFDFVDGATSSRTMRVRRWA